MNRTIYVWSSTALVAVVLVLVAMPALAAFECTELGASDDGEVFACEFKRKGFGKGGWASDTPKRNSKKFAENIHKVCIEKDFDHYHTVTLADRVQDEKLARMHEIAFPGEAGGVDRETHEGGGGGTQRTFVVSGLVIYRVGEADEFLRCEESKKKK